MSDRIHVLPSNPSFPWPVFAVHNRFAEWFIQNDRLSQVKPHRKANPASRVSTRKQILISWRCGFTVTDVEGLAKYVGRFNQPRIEGAGHVVVLRKASILL